MALVPSTGELLPPGSEEFNYNQILEHCKWFAQELISQGIPFFYSNFLFAVEYRGQHLLAFELDGIHKQGRAGMLPWNQRELILKDFE